MTVKLVRFWFEFDISDAELRTHKRYGGLTLGCGVTAYGYEDALLVLQKDLFRDEPIPAIKRVVENVDVSRLDANHVLPNIGVPTWRGVWFPRISVA
jgi:hypothetical protein